MKYKQNPFFALRRAKKRVELRLKNEGKSDDGTHPHAVRLDVAAEVAIAEVAIPTVVGVVLGGRPTIGLRVELGLCIFVTNYGFCAIAGKTPF